MKTLILITSCEKNTVKRCAIRQTWGKDVKFIMAGKSRVDGDILYVDSLDDYEHLPQKNRLAIEWALKQDCDYIFKCDDDAYVKIDRLFKLAGDYIGEGRCFDPRRNINFVSKPQKGYDVWVSGGSGFLLARKAAEIVVKELGDIGRDDYEIGKILEKHGILPEHNEGFYQFCPNPIPNDFISVSNLTSQQILTLGKYE